MHATAGVPRGTIAFPWNRRSSHKLGFGAFVPRQISHGCIRSSCCRCLRDGPDDFDIDALAKRLSSEAASRLRGESSSDDEQPDKVSDLPSSRAGPFGNEAARQVDADLRGLGVAPLLAANFVVFKQLGTLVVQQMVAGELPSGASAGAGTAVPSVVAYAATYETGQPFQGPVTVLLKEFLPGSTRAGVTELQVLNSIQALPDERSAWQAASRGIEDNGVVPAVGWFRSPPSQAVPGYEGSDAASLWVVYKWEALKPLVAYPSYQQPAPRPQLWVRSGSSPLKQRCRMLRALMRGALRAVDRCHRQGVTHGSLGTGSMMVNVFDDASADEVVVKLDNFGFAQRFEGRGGEGGQSLAGSSVYGRRLDYRALAAAFCEIVFCSFSTDDLPGSSGAASIQRLVTDVYADNFDAFRAYAETVDEWADAVDFLADVDGGGWDLLDSLMSADQDCGSLLESPFLSV